jgi:hypothetical protein
MKEPIQINGTFPELAARAILDAPRTEIGIGALMPWADRLWFACYPSEVGAGHGLFYIDEANTRRALWGHMLTA